LKRAAALLVLGLLQMAGDVFRVPALRGIAAATAASPAPKVFSVVNGLETYSTRFVLEWTARAGKARSLALTSEVYPKIRGPYNRRNAYGAVTAYGPILDANPRTAPMFRSVARYALCGDAPLMRELGVEPAEIAGPVRIRLEPLATTPAEIPRLIEVDCGAKADR
jgi:hypothetical protein